VINVVVVVGVRLYREALARVLSEQRDLTVAGEAATADRALAEIERARPDVVLLDLDVDGALIALRAASSATRVVALGFGGTDEEALIAAEAGVSGYVGVHQSLPEVAIAIRSVMRGEAPCDGRIAAALLRRVEATARKEGATPFAGLTRRELRILEMIARGQSNKEIASELVIGVATVKSHVHAILRKLGVDGRGAAADLFRRAQRGASLQPLG
jgi:two-component system, NarL family, nitrate/nitrite response regulator NarL